METALVIHKGINELLPVLKAGIGDAYGQSYYHIDSVEELEAYLGSTADEKADLLLLGPRIEDPVPYLQLASALDKLLSVLLVIDPDRISTAQMNIKFAPFITNAFKIVESTSVYKVIEEVNEGILRTQQRRGYENLNRSLKNGSES